MPATYSEIKAAVLEVIDDFSPHDVVAQYASKYSAKTKLSTLGITAPALSVMPPRMNKVMRQVAGNAWQWVGPLDLVAQITIGDLIRVGCTFSQTPILDGEPK